MAFSGTLQNRRENIRTCGVFVTSFCATILPLYNSASLCTMLRACFLAKLRCRATKPTLLQMLFSFAFYQLSSMFTASCATSNFVH